MTIDLPLCPEDINQIINVVIDKEQLKDPKVTFGEGSKIGEGYLGVDTSVKIKDGDKILNLFIKTAPKHAKMREVMKIKSVYQNEIHFYKIAHPLMQEFYKNKTGRALEIAPKCYAINEEELKEMIVLENVKVGGFDLADSSKPFDKDIVKVTMTNFGKYHGISFAIKDQNEELFDKITANIPDDIISSMLENMGVHPMVKGICKRMEKHLKSSDDNRYLEKLIYIGENLTDLLLDARAFRGEHRVLVHGDCNGNNYMFRKNDDNLETIMVDFQGLKLSSPISDLSYFFYAGAASEENLNNFDSFLDIYYQSLYTTVEELGSDPKKICPKDVIQKHWKVFGPTGLTMFMLLLRKALNPNHSVDLLKRVQDIGNKSSMEPIDNEEKYSEIFIRIFKHMVDKNIL